MSSNPKKRRLPSKWRISRMRNSVSRTLSDDNGDRVRLKRGAKVQVVVRSRAGDDYTES